jgi:hypothetical protein
MTEAEWQSGPHPYPLIDYLCRSRKRNRTKADRRRLWLYGCACCRSAWHLFEEDYWPAAVVIAAEQFADGHAKFTEVQRCDARLHIPTYYNRTQSVALAARSLAYTDVLVMASGVAQYCAQAAVGSSPPSEHHRIIESTLSHAARLLRCIFGNPFRPVAFDPAWRTSDVLSLAKGIYDDRAFDRMPILADALQDAGCTNDILSHCRDTQLPHARGCWVVDLVLGKA